MSGLIRRVIWVWPSWDQENHNESYQSFYTELGWTNAKQAREDSLYDSLFYHHRTVFCQCHTVIDQHDQEGTKQCHQFDIISRPKDPVQSLDPSKCNVMTSYVGEHIRDDEFQSRLKTQNMFGHNEALLVNIDQSFFGLASPKVLLQKSGLTNLEINLLNSKIKGFLCPVSSEEENLADHFMQSGLKLFERLCVVGGLEETKCSAQLIQRDVTVILEDFAVTFMADEPGIFCHNDDPTVRAQWGTILQLISSFGLHAITRMLQVGFCLRTSPQTLGFDDEGEFQLCIGEQEHETPPYDTLEILDSGQLGDHMTRVKDMLQSPGLPMPEVVTLCRSVRTGRTASLISPLVESTLIETINRTLPYANKLVLHHDQHLLGGKKGWYNRDFGPGHRPHAGQDGKSDASVL